ncbi:hypothetical protein BH11BAC7_BH11BAC7_04560 [soil metagenome]
MRISTHRRLRVFPKRDQVIPYCAGFVFIRLLDENYSLIQNLYTMKKIMLLVSISLFSIISLNAQQVFAVPFPAEVKQYIPEKTMRIASANGNEKLVDSLYLVIDTLKYKLYHDSVEKNTDRVFVYGAGSTDALDFKQFSAAASVSAMFRFWHDNMILAASVNVGAKIQQQESDSVSVNDLYFPDVANASAAGSLEWNFRNTFWPSKFSNSKQKADKILNEKIYENHQWALRFDVSLQNKLIKKDSISYKLGVFNFDAGPQYRWSFAGKNSHKADFSFGVFYNYILISDQSYSNFNQIFNDYAAPASKIQPYFHGFSTLFSFQINDSFFYVRTYTDLKSRSDLAFSVGIKQAIKFTSF